MASSRELLDSLKPGMHLDKNFQEWHDEVMQEVPDKAKLFIEKIFIAVANNL